VASKKDYVQIKINLHGRIIFNKFVRVFKLNYMNTKLTLTIEQNVIDKAKKYAKKKGHSLSDIVENYLKVITKNEPNQEIEYTPLVKSLLGTFKAPNNFDYKKELAKSLSNKYLNE
jgi:3-isopropylmalate dehydratase small subunit